jgi:hypothetical protein
LALGIKRPRLMAAIIVLTVATAVSQMIVRVKWIIDLITDCASSEIWLGAMPRVECAKYTRVHTRVCFCPKIV